MVCFCWDFDKQQRWPLREARQHGCDHREWKRSQSEMSTVPVVLALTQNCQKRERENVCVCVCVCVCARVFVCVVILERTDRCICVWKLVPFSVWKCFAVHVCGRRANYLHWFCQVRCSWCATQDAVFYHECASDIWQTQLTPAEVHISHPGGKIAEKEISALTAEASSLLLSVGEFPGI